MTTIELDIVAELVKTAEILDGQSDLLCIFGSFNDTLPDEQVLAELKLCNELHAITDNKSLP